MNFHKRTHLCNQHSAEETEYFQHPGSAPVCPSPSIGKSQRDPLTSNAANDFACFTIFFLYMQLFSISTDLSEASVSFPGKEGLNPEEVCLF